MAPRSAQLAPQLRSGDRVSIVSPASYPTEEHLANMVDELEGWGLRVDVAPHALAKYGPMAGTDDERLGDLDEAFRDPGIRAVFASRGGAGSYRIVDRLDIEAVRRDPKPVVGFSDITNLHLRLWAGARAASIHGCVGRNQAAEDVHQMLMDGAALTVEADPEVITAPLRAGGRATGVLLGGNLREVAGMVGAGLPDLTGAIVFFEDLRHVGIGQVDRNLSQLRRSGALDGVAGIVLGLFDGFEDFIDRDWHLLDVLSDRLLSLGVPVLGGIKSGHGGVNERGEPDQRSLCLGAPAVLDVDAGTLAMSPCVG